MGSNIFIRYIKKFLLRDIGFTIAIMKYNWDFFWATSLLKISPDRIFKPGRVNIMLTGKCNIRCEMCAQWGVNSGKFYPSRDHGHISIGLFNKIIDEIKAFKPLIYLWGGEPLLHPQIADICGMIKKNRLHCLINTNGTLLENNAQTMIDNDIDGILVSLLGDEETHDKITQSKGSYRKVMEGIKELNALKKKYKKRKPFMQAHTIISSSNYMIIEKIIKQAEDNNFDTIWLQGMCFITEIQGNNYAKIMKDIFKAEGQSWKGFVNRPDIDVERLKEGLKKGLKYLKNTVPIFLPSCEPRNIENYFMNPDIVIKKQRCSVIWNQVDIMPNGDVTSCHDYQDFITGNVNRQNLIDLYNNEQYGKLRKYIIEKGPLPICSRCVGTISV